MPRCHVQLNSVEPLGAVNVTVFTSPWCMAPVLTCRPSMVKLWLLSPALRTSTVTAEPAGTSRTCGWNVLSCMRIRTAPGPAAPARTLPAAFSPCWQPASRTTSPMATPTVNSILQRPIWIPPDPTLPSCGDRGGCGSLPCPSMPDLCCAFMSSPSLFQALRGRLGCSCRCGWLPVVVAGVAGLPDPPVDHPQRRRQPPKDGLDLPWGGLIQHPGQELRGAADADAAALVVAERLPLGRGEGLVDQRQHVALLVGQVPVQPGGQGVDGVPEALVAAVAVGEGAVDRLEQRVDAGVLVLHGLQQSQLVGTVGQVGAHARPQVLILGGAAAGGACQVAKVAAEGVVEGHHQRQVQVAGRLAGHRHAPLGRAAVSACCGTGACTARSMPSTARVVPKVLTSPEASTAGAGRSSGRRLPRRCAFHCHGCLLERWDCVMTTPAGAPGLRARRPGLLMRLGDPFGGERHAQTVQLHPDPSLGVAVARTLRAGPAGGITPRCTPPVESLGGGRPGRYTLVPSEVSP